MAVRIEHHPNMLLRLMFCLSRPGPDGPGDGGVQVVDTDVEVHGRSLLARLARPHWPSVRTVLLDIDRWSRLAFGRAQLSPATLRANVDDRPAQQPVIEIRQLTRPARLRSNRHRADL
jgi:hypothetical protein